MAGKGRRRERGRWKKRRGGAFDSASIEKGGKEPPSVPPPPPPPSHRNSFYWHRKGGKREKGNSAVRKGRRRRGGFSPSLPPFLSARNVACNGEGEGKTKSQSVTISMLSWREKGIFGRDFCAVTLHVKIGRGGLLDGWRDDDCGVIVKVHQTTTEDPSICRTVYFSSRFGERSDENLPPPARALDDTNPVLLYRCNVRRLAAYVQFGVFAVKPRKKIL